MNGFARLADRLLERLVPKVTADAACIWLRTENWSCTGAPCLPWPQGGWEQKRVFHYDNCAPRVEKRCVGRC
jgi:hypothetical protein